MAITEDISPPQKKAPSPIMQIAVLLVLTGAAAGAGWLSGLHLNARRDAPAVAPAAAEGEIGKEAAAPASPGSILPLQPITTNLAGPGDTWVRMELALVFEGSTDAALGELVHQDILAYLRTVTVNQVEGASGFQHLRSDLEERARIRSGGKVKSILVRALLFE